MCNDCAKIMCKNRDKLVVCNNKVTYTKANILDKPEKVEDK